MQMEHVGEAEGLQTSLLERESQSGRDVAKLLLHNSKDTVELSSLRPPPW